MIFPRNNPGRLVIDNVEITRIKTRPTVSDIHILGSFNVSETITYDYRFQDLEDEPEGNTLVEWVIALRPNGLNRLVLSEISESLIITSDMVGKYIGVQITPKSTYDGPQATGNSVTYFSNTPVGGTQAVLPPQVSLDFSESFIEDFEIDTAVTGNIYAHPSSGVNAYLTNDTNRVIEGDVSLYVNTVGAYSGIHFSGIRFASRGVYTVSFSYKVLEKPDVLYVQFRSPTGYTAHDKFSMIDMSLVTVGNTYTFTHTFSLDEFNDYYLMIFPSSKGGQFVIDDLQITRGDAESVPITSRELEVGESMTIDFDSPTSTLALDKTQTPNSQITNEEGKSIDDYSLYVESPGYFQSLMIAQGFKPTANATYRITFDYKVIEMQDTIYFQFNAGGAHSVFKEFGQPSTINTIQQFDETFTLGNHSNYIIQIFPGSTVGTTRVIIDNIIIERLS